MSIVRKIRKTAQTVQSIGEFCVTPTCLHVAGSVKCSKSCCKTSKSGKGKKR
jgi:hypothetical protein